MHKFNKYKNNILVVMQNYLKCKNNFYIILDHNNKDGY